MLAWLQDNGPLLAWMTIASAVLCVVTVVGVGVVIVRMPADAFQKDKRSNGRNLAIRIARNIVGWVLILAGLAMLVLPGQGLLVLLIGIMLAEFPGKYRLERWIVSRGKVLASINWLRRKFRRPPLDIRKQPEHKPGAADTAPQHASVRHA